MAKQEEKKAEKVEDVMKLFDRISELGKMEGVVKLTDQFSVIISTVSAEDEANIFKNCTNYSGAEYIMKSKLETLAFAIVGVNGKKFDYLEVEDEEERRKAKETTVIDMRKIVGTWRDEVTTFVYTKWLELTGSSEQHLEKLGIIAESEVKRKVEQLQKDAEDKAKEIEKEATVTKEDKEEKEEIKK